jgi:hypothetical protein
MDISWGNNDTFNTVVKNDKQFPLPEYRGKQLQMRGSWVINFY